MNEFHKFNFYKNKVVINCLAKDIHNAKEILDAGEGHIAIGLLSTRHSTIEKNIEEVKEFKKEIPLISVGLGGGSPKQWHMAAHIAANTDPGHVNQVFPAAGYTKGLLEGKKCSGTVVNALISPTGTVGRVKINTGIFSDVNDDSFDLKTTLLMMKDIGLNSVKFFNMKGLTYLDELSAVASACKEVGIEMIEPTGGLTPENVGQIIETCRNSGVKYIMPHIYSSIIDKETGNTIPEKVFDIFKTIKQII